MKGNPCKHKIVFEKTVIEINHAETDVEENEEQVVRLWEVKVCLSISICVNARVQYVYSDLCLYERK